MRPQAPPPAPEDVALFNAAVGPVRRLRQSVRSLDSAPPPAAVPRQLELDEAQALITSQSDPFARGLEDRTRAAYRRPEVSPRTLQRLRRGHYAIEDEFDLHGLSALAAERVLREFLVAARKRGVHCVCIVHGKGMHSERAEPVLRPLVERLLARRSDVLAYASAPTRAGGDGATLVLLARTSHTALSD